MIRNYLNIALRTLQKHKGYAVINVLGLAVGLAASLLIVQYVVHELSYDDFHADSDRIYRIRFDLHREGDRLFKAATTYPAVGPALEADFPEVEAQARLFLRYGGGVVQHGDRSFREDLVFHADASFLTLFSYPMLQGDRETALNAPNTVVISEAIAQKYFGPSDPLGERIRFGTDEEYTITGVMRSPENSHLKFNFLFSFSTLRTLDWAPLEQYAWNWYDFYTYVRLRPEADPAALEAALPAFIARHKGELASGREVLSLQPLEAIHLHSDLIQEARPNGDGAVVYFLAVIAGCILVIAWVNYINLSTARAVERAKEVGVRKAIGAQRGQLVHQFLIEALLLNVAAVGVALVAAKSAEPLFGALVGRPMTLSLLTRPSTWVGLAGAVVLGAGLSGLYPALVLSRSRPARALKGRMRTGQRGSRLRQGLVVAQFVASVGLIAGTLIVYQQLSYMRQQDLGIETDQRLVVEAPGAVDADHPEYAAQIESFKQELMRQGAVRRVAASTEIPGNLIYWASGMRQQGRPSEANTVLYQVGIDAEYLNVFGHELLAGRNLRPAAPADSQRVLLNETAVRALGFASAEAALDQRIVGGPDTLTVAGVVADYHQEGLFKPIDPIGFRVRTPDQAYRFFTLDVSTADLSATVSAVNATFKRFFPDNPFNYAFMDDLYNRQYQAYERFGQVFGVFALLAILVACLGLFGLSSLAAVRRTKEIGIRKALGASVPGIAALLSKEFAQLVLVAFVIAAPIAYIAAQQWLQDFAYHIDLGVGVFLLAGALALAIALLTVSCQSIRAALTDPVKALRYE